MNRKIAAVLVIALVTSVLVSTAPTTAAAPRSVAPPIPLAAPSKPSALGDGVGNYQVPGQKDVIDVAVSADGEYVAGITTGAQVIIFTNSTLGVLDPIAVFTTPDGVDPSSVSISGPLSGSGPHVVVFGWAHWVDAFNITSSSSEVDLNDQTPFWAITNFTVAFGLVDATQPYVHQVLISASGDWIGLQAGYIVGSSTPEVVTAYVEFTGVGYSTIVGSSFFGYPINLAMDWGGEWMVAGMNLLGTSAVLVFEGTRGWVGNFTDFAGGQLYSVGMSGNGRLFYGAASNGVYIFNGGVAPTSPGFKNYTISVNNIDVVPGTAVSASYSGDQIVVGGGYSAAYYFNYTQSWTETWNATFAAAVANVTVSLTQPNYFAVSTGTNVYWYYFFQGIASGGSAGAEAYYRNWSTPGDIYETAMSANHDTVVIGSAYVGAEQTGAAGEFTVASDGGIPSPGVPTISVTVLGSTPGQSTASLQVSWTEVTNVPIFESLLYINLSSASATGLPPPINPVRLLSSPQTVGGLGFGTTYCLSITVEAFGGASSASSELVCAKTTGQPLAVDPVQVFEYSATGVLAIGIVGLIALSMLTARRRKDRTEPAPMGSGSPAQGMPPAGPPQMGGPL
jgi:hypothetical protein